LRAVCSWRRPTCRVTVGFAIVAGKGPGAPAVRVFAGTPSVHSLRMERFESTFRVASTSARCQLKGTAHWGGGVCRRWDRGQGSVRVPIANLRQSLSLAHAVARNGRQWSAQLATIIHSRPVQFSGRRPLYPRLHELPATDRGANRYTYVASLATGANGDIRYCFLHQQCASSTVFINGLYKDVPIPNHHRPRKPLWNPSARRCNGHAPSSVPCHRDFAEGAGFVLSRSIKHFSAWRPIPRG